MSEVLVLNRNFRAIQLTDWRRAVSLVFLDHALVVDQEYKTYNFEDWMELSQAISEHPSGFIHTPAFRLAIPEVITLKIFDKIPKLEVKFTRRNIYEHYDHRCCYCGRRFPTKELNLEHVVPSSRGGRTTWENIVTSCIPCNLKKGNSLPHEAGMKLLIKPSKPGWSHRPSLLICGSVPVRASWQRFIDNIYWNSPLED